MSARVTRKRARLEAEQQEAEDEGVSTGNDGSGDEGLGGLARDEEFWFDDGTIVLGARNVAFKVYAGPLIEHSPVFKTMLLLPQPLDASNASDPGAERVIYLPDSPEDLRHVFEVLMPGKTLR